MVTSARQISVGDLVARIIFRGDTAALDNANRRVSNLRGNLNSLSSTLTLTGGAVTAFATLAVRETINTEVAYAKLRGQVGLTNEEIASLRPEVQSISAEFGLLESQGADALFTITSNGQRGAEALNTLRSTAQLSASEFGELRQLAEATLPTLNAYAEVGLDAAVASDRLAAAVRVGNFQAPQLARALPVIVANAASLGVAFEDVLGSLAASSRVQPRIVEGATALRQILQALTSPTAAAQKVLSEYNISLDDLAEGLRTDYLGTLERLHATVGQDTIAFRELLGSVEALTGFNNIFAQGFDTTRQIFDDIRNSAGASDMTFEAFADGGMLAARQATAEFRNTLSETGAVMLPLAVEMSRTVLPILRAFRNEIEDGNPALLALIRAVVVAGPALLAMAVAVRAVSLALAVAQGLGLIRGVAILATTLNRGTIAMTGFNAQLAIQNVLLRLNPIIAIVTAVIALGVALVAVVKYWEEIWGFVSAIAETVGSIGRSIFGGSSDSAGLPGFQQGGIVPGREGEPVVAVVHAGELVVPAPAVARYQSGDAGARLQVGDINVTTNVTGSVDAEEVSRLTAEGVRSVLREESRRLDALRSDVL